MAILNTVAKTIVYTPLVLLCLLVIVGIGYGIMHYRKEKVLPKSYISVFDMVIILISNMIKPISWLLKKLWWLIPITPGVRGKFGFSPMGAWAPNVRFRTGLVLTTIMMVVSSILVLKKGYPSEIRSYSDFLTGFLFLLTSIMLIASYVEFNKCSSDNKSSSIGAAKKNTMKYLYYMIFVGLTLAISTLILYLTVNHGFINIASSSMLMMIFGLGLMFLIYNKLLKNSGIKNMIKKNGLLSKLFYIVFIIPCLFQDTVKFIFNQVRHTPKIAFSFIAVEILLVGIYVIYPIMKEYLYTLMPSKNNKKEIIESKINSINKEQIVITARKKKIMKFDNLMKSDWNSIIETNLNNPAKVESLKKKLLDLGYSNQSGNDQISENKREKLNNAIKYIQKNTTQLISLRMKHKDNIERLKTLKEQLSRVNDLQKSKLLLNEPVYLKNKKTLSNFEDVKMINYDMDYNYNYAISFWVFIRAQPPNFGEQYNKYTSILNYGEKPNILYNGKLNKLKIVMNNGRNKKPVEHIIDNFPLQKWSNIVVNYDGGILDIFMNKKLLTSVNRVIPYMNQDQITVGDYNGIGGGICNVVYFPSSISKERIDMNYKILSNKNPPII